MANTETAYVNELLLKIRDILPSAFVLKPDPSEIQGIPDILILFEDKWAMLEVKLDEFSPVQPNQGYYIDLFNSMSFGAFIYPQNEVEVLSALQSAFGVTRQTRLFESQ